MVASNATIAAVYKVLRKHLPPLTITSIIADLEEVAGNKSFRATIDGLRQLHRQTAYREYQRIRIERHIKR